NMNTTIPAIPPELFRLTAENTGIRVAFVEKDFWAISLLKRVLAIHPDLVFKGGTSLSKCHHIIDRFSEDLDVSLQKPHYSVGERRKIVHGIRDLFPLLGLELKNADQIRSKRVFNRMICSFPSFFQNESTDETLILELANQTPSFPVESKPIQTFVGEYLKKKERIDLVDQYQLEAFEVQVQKLERTFVDKVFAICDYSFTGKIRRQSRHIYDLQRINSEVTKDDSLISLFLEVRDYRRRLDSCPSAKEGVRLSEVLKGVFSSKLYEDDYEKMTSPLLYRPLSYDEAAAVLPIISSFLESAGL
ncbi:MAG: nucleotidyl transferase AbiEii/AbiGii toxin family protein, partial [Bacilli bacterium]|nr:nucleotidyl transferase AbiEii/AbiGii toxin family protein [Bacilli bacterium]